MIVKQKRIYAGQTLIEALITILLVAGGILALIRFQNYLAYDNSLSQQRAEATIIGIRRLEILRDYQRLATTSGFTAYQDIASGTATVTGVNATYNLNWTVTSFTNPTYKTVELTVSWTDRNNVSRSIQLSTRIAGIEPSFSAVII